MIGVAVMGIEQSILYLYLDVGIVNELFLVLLDFLYMLSLFFVLPSPRLGFVPILDCLVVLNCLFFFLEIEIVVIVLGLEQTFSLEVFLDCT